jgi:ABC-type polysaccharide/polyol phosphate export permease
MAMIYVVFLRLLARGIPTEEIIIGVFAWQFTVQSVNAGLDSIIGNANLVKKVLFPRLILPLATTLAALISYLLSLVVQFILVAILLTGQHASIDGSVWILPGWIAYHFLFNLALAMLIGSTNVYFRDTQHLTGVLLSAWFFVSPVMYPYSLVQEFAGTWPGLADFYMLNPMAILVTGYRALVLPGADFPWSPFSLAGLALPLILAAVAFAVFHRAQKNFADML